MIRCGWCGNPTANRDRCTSCGHVDPERPWHQRGEPVPSVHVDAAGRPALDRKAIRRRLEEARHALGADATVEQIAEFLNVSVRTVGRWRKLAG